MTFTAEQKAALDAPLSKTHVKERSQSGRTLSYIEGWVCISEANRIFGFDAWSSETIDIRCVAERERSVGSQNRPGWGVSYVAKVRITVDGVMREGVGSGHGIDVDLGLAHESAIKEAETDGRKRALMTFGNPFGLALYDKTQANVSNDAPEPQRAPLTGITPASEGKDWWGCDGPGMTAHAAKKAGLDEAHEIMRHDLQETASLESLRRWTDANQETIASMPRAWRIELRHEADEAVTRINSGQGKAA